eukprot:6056390-Pyramimonas_sp.AAC.1
MPTNNELKLSSLGHTGWRLLTLELEAQLVAGYYGLARSPSGPAALRPGKTRSGGRLTGAYGRAGACGPRR